MGGNYILFFSYLGIIWTCQKTFIDLYSCVSPYIVIKCAFKWTISGKPIIIYSWIIFVLIEVCFCNSHQDGIILKRIYTGYMLYFNSYWIIIMGHVLVRRYVIHSISFLDKGKIRKFLDIERKQPIWWNIDCIEQIKRDLAIF